MIFAPRPTEPCAVVSFVVLEFLQRQKCLLSLERCSVSACSLAPRLASADLSPPINCRQLSTVGWVGVCHQPPPPPPSPGQGTGAFAAPAPLTAGPCSRATTCAPAVFGRLNRSVCEHLLSLSLAGRKCQQG